MRKEASKSPFRVRPTFQKTCLFRWWASPKTSPPLSSWAKNCHPPALHFVGLHLAIAACKQLASISL